MRSSLESAESQKIAAMNEAFEQSKSRDGAFEQIGIFRENSEKAMEAEKAAKYHLEQAEAQTVEARERLATMTEAHTTKWRIGSIRLDPEALTANLRRVVPSIKVEQDRHLYVIYSDKELEEADLNRVKAELQSLLDMDRT